MKQRIRIGIIFNFSPKWMGGIVYIINLIKTLAFLDDKDMPELILFYRSDLSKIVDEIKYPYLNAVEWKFPSAYKGYLISWLSGKNIFVNEILEKYDLDGLYPLQDFPVKTKTRTKIVGWYPDLQHKYYPGFFTRTQIIERNSRIRFMLRNSDSMIVSSRSVADDYNCFYTIPDNLKVHIYSFVSVVDDYLETNISELKNKYGLPENYFIISNQFHKHKNHKVVLKALALIKKQGNSVHFAFTGKFPDSRHSDHIRELHELIEVNQLHDQLSFLGVIPRKEQLALFKYSKAVIQPSLFEGWSTVIEDAKSLQVPVIASNIPVNIEQLGPGVTYFDPNDDKELAEILNNFPQRNINDVFYTEYSERVIIAAKFIMNIFHI